MSGVDHTFGGYTTECEDEEVDCTSCPHNGEVVVMSNQDKWNSTTGGTEYEFLFVDYESSLQGIACTGSGNAGTGASGYYYNQPWKQFPVRTSGFWCG